MTSKLSSFLEWLGSKSLAHLFAITRHLERENSSLKSEINSIKQELIDLRKESLQKIYQAVGLSGSVYNQEDSGMPLELFEQEKSINSMTPISDLVEKAEQEDWVAWQEAERLRLQQAKLVHEEFHRLN